MSLTRPDGKALNGHDVLRAIREWGPIAMTVGGIFLSVVGLILVFMPEE